MSAEAQQVVALLDDVRWTGFSLPTPQVRSQSATQNWKFGSPGHNLGGKKPFTGSVQKRAQFMNDLTANRS